MELKISAKKKAKIQPDMYGLFFEDINYSADGGLHAEMIENRNFEFVDAAGDWADYYTEFDGGYGWKKYPENSTGSLKIVSGSPLSEENPHYLRFEAKTAEDGFTNKAYDGICLKKGMNYKVTFFAKNVSFDGTLNVSVQKEARVVASAEQKIVLTERKEWKKWERYELMLTAKEDVRYGDFVISLSKEGVMEFDFISMIPEDAVEGVFRKDLYEKLEALKPGFIRFPGGCIVEGNTLATRYRYKDTLKAPWDRKVNWNRWAVHENRKENEFHSQYSHYNQTYGIGFYEYFLLCEKIGAKPLPVLNVGLACQYQSLELIEPEDAAFQEFLEDALDLIEFANGAADTKWGAVRAKMGHPKPFHLEMLGIGNEQWETEKSRFFERYQLFEKAIHKKYPTIRLIGSAGPDITSEKYEAAWNFYHENMRENFVYAVDEHYYVKPEWFYEHTDFYDNYDRKIKVFSGEYAAHPCSGMNMPKANTEGGALAEAAFLTGVERNADVVVLSSYAPLFARVGYTQWSPDMIWFDDAASYETPSYYVQKLYSENKGTVTLDTFGQEKTFSEKGFYYNTVLDEDTGEVILKAVNHSGTDMDIQLVAEGGEQLQLTSEKMLRGEAEDFNSISEPEKVKITEEKQEFVNQTYCFKNQAFYVIRLKVQK